ncbi:hypothetical protein O2W15_23785 [Modestobacter sp. VKM Ac-2979]|uniref:hypothetical protein n=1 Tax=unclassified Modestobacter TaxID=2643866 RepID=UPI0022ABBBB6|nr:MULTISPECIES: hypothetical protein [unclassified Modestobacter]MCZ2814465.1 hypothetical protein [Modestobacter sp. VKM Ac-2979]MCZ2844791.1 hypothetical protein [Modestobacter sp. VKM Ac-2980]
MTAGPTAALTSSAGEAADRHRVFSGPESTRRLWRVRSSVTLDGNLIATPGGLAALLLTAAPRSADAARLVEVVGATDGRAVIKVGQSGPG